MMNNKVSFTNSNNPTISLSAVIYFPPKFDETRQYQAIVVSHPGGGVKEQTAGTYAKKLAEKGFVTIAYDASYQGESGGEPRQLENPYIRTEDISAVIDYLTTLSYVDNTRIGAMGICAGAGYTANAAIQDRRIKAIGTVSAVNIGSMFRNGWENNVKSIDALPYVEAGSNARTSDISSGEYAVMPLAPMKESDAPNEELRQAWEYYHTSHPGGGVKEQTAGTYAKKLAEKGFVTIAYDASYQGESGGEPRQLENPYIRTEDISAVIDYLTTLSYVDNTRIGAMGICAGAGYTANAAIQDRRIKAIGTVSAVNIGSMFRNGWENNVKSIDALPYVEAGSNARTSDISSGEYAVMPLAPMKESDAPNEELRQAWEYYHTPRAQYPTAPGYATLRSLNQIITYDAYHMAEVYLTQPMQIVAGSQAGSKWMSDDLYDRASSQDKRYHIVEGANHMDLYDGKAYVAEAISVLAPFFEETL